MYMYRPLHTCVRRLTWSRKDSNMVVRCEGLGARFKPLFPIVNVYYLRVAAL
jgi:hypothetical protein